MPAELLPTVSTPAGSTQVHALKFMFFNLNTGASLAALNFCAGSGARVVRMPYASKNLTVLFSSIYSPGVPGSIVPCFVSLPLTNGSGLEKIYGVC